eukprot:scaffold30864_cov91-Isochrysis_galbana.AAC.2
MRAGQEDPARHKTGGQGKKNSERHKTGGQGKNAPAGVLNTGNHRRAAEAPRRPGASVYAATKRTPAEPNHTEQLAQRGVSLHPMLLGPWSVPRELGIEGALEVLPRCPLRRQALGLPRPSHLVSIMGQRSLDGRPLHPAGGIGADGLPGGVGVDQQRGPRLEIAGAPERRQPLVARRRLRGSLARRMHQHQQHTAAASP